MNTFLRWFCDNLILELTQDNQQLQQKLVDKLDEHWKLAQRIGSMKTCKDYFERYVFPEFSHPLTLALEEVDRIFEYPKIYKEFFGLLRSLHEEAKRRDIWKQLRLVIVHSTEAYVPMDIALLVTMFAPSRAGWALPTVHQKHYKSVANIWIKRGALGSKPAKSQDMEH